MNAFALNAGVRGLGGMLRRALALTTIITALGLAACGTEDTGQTQEQKCSFDDECDLGEVCLVDGVCGAVDCEFCQPGQICYTDADGNSSCSRPECTQDSECDGDKSCIDGLCSDATCQAREDCPEGQICNVLAGKCVAPPDVCTTDFDCPVGNICKDDGTCSPGCSSDDQCDAGKFCNTDINICEDGCRDSTECTAEQTCDDSNQCVCDPSKCAEGFICDEGTNGCVENTATSCDDVTCGEGQTCDPTTLTCVEAPMGCTTEPDMPNSCPVGTVCNTATGDCDAQTCIDKTPEDCAGTDAPYLNQDFCECVECLSDENCDTAAGETCNFNGQCQAPCQTPCDPGTPGTCMGSTPYCFGGCCVECIGAADCAAGQICLDGMCGDPPDCSVDPTVCPSGYECVGGTCQAAAAGTSCDPSNPMSCPPGQFCQASDPNNPTSGTCQGLGGGNNCGGCNPDCTCDNGLTCDTLLGLCTGCTDNSQCPPLDLGLGIPLPGLCLGGLCLDFSM